MIGKIISIKATSRASVKIRDSYYTVEYTEERMLPTDIDYDITAEREELWTAVNGECDEQISDIINSFK